MGTIKTAMELAMERTASLTADHAAVDALEARKEGMRLAAAYMDAADTAEAAAALAGGLKALAASRAEAAKKGILDSILSAMQFPRSEAAAVPVDRVREGLCLVAGKKDSDKAISELCEQLRQFFERYVKDLDGLEEELKRQYAPKLKQKEQELRRRTGQDVKLDPMRDPEFTAYFQKNMLQVKGRYQEALDRAKADLRALAES